MSTILTTKWMHRAPFALEGMALEMPELREEHLNRLPFRGILTQIDEPSTRPPNGSSGHRVLIPRAVAEQAIPSLMGMPIDCSLGLKDHDKKTVIGVITGAEIQGNDLVVVGHLLAKNFPEEIAEIQSRKTQLGMSYEISNVHVEDVDAEIWTLTGLQFTGAAILYKHAAAYQHTAIAARAEEDEMAGATEKILDKLNAIDGKLRHLEAGRMDEDDEAAAKDEADAQEQEEAAARYDAAAMQAREDSDDEDAAKQDTEAARARQAASTLRLAAAKRHEDAAMKLRAAKQDDEAAKEEAEAEAKRHEAEAKRLKEMDDKCKAEAEAARADLAAARAEEASEEEAESTSRMMAMMLKAMSQMQGAQTAAKAKDTKKKTDDEVMERMFGMLLRGMTYMPGMMEGQQAVHDDEEEDKKLIREMLRKGKKPAMAASTPVVNLEEKRRLRRIEAAMELLTDQVSKLAGLITDSVHSRRDLATDANNGANGGPVRRTMQAESWVDKYGETRNGTETKRTDGKMTMAEIEAAMDEQGITDPSDRIARKVELQRAGKVAN